VINAFTKHHDSSYCAPDDCSLHPHPISDLFWYYPHAHASVCSVISSFQVLWPKLCLYFSYIGLPCVLYASSISCSCWYLLIEFSAGVVSVDRYPVRVKNVRYWKCWYNYEQENPIRTCKIKTRCRILLIKPTNTHTVYNYIFVSVSPLHVSVVKPPSSGGTKGHRLCSASEVIQHYV
jgi:hypothetical protein